MAVELSNVLEFCADAYNDNATTNFLSSGWMRLNIYNNEIDKVSDDINDYYYKTDRNGFNASIYYNTKTQELVVAIRGTEPLVPDDVMNSLAIFNKKDYSQKDELEDFKTLLDQVINKYQKVYPNFNISKYYVVGQSLGGALATQFANDNKKYEAITVNGLGIGYQGNISGENVTNYIAMNDVLSLLNYEYLVGTTKLIFPVASRLGFNPTEKNRGYKTELKTVA